MTCWNFNMEPSMGLYCNVASPGENKETNARFLPGVCLRTLLTPKRHDTDLSVWESKSKRGLAQSFLAIVRPHLLFFSLEDMVQSNLGEPPHICMLWTPKQKILLKSTPKFVTHLILIFSVLHSNPTSLVLILSTWRFRSPVVNARQA